MEGERERERERSDEVRTYVGPLVSGGVSKRYARTNDNYTHRNRSGGKCLGGGTEGGSDGESTEQHDNWILKEVQRSIICCRCRQSLGECVSCGFMIFDIADKNLQGSKDILRSFQVKIECQRLQIANCN